MSLSGKNIVVIGAAGVVGSGIVRKALDAGANVTAVSRTQANLASLAERIGAKGHASLRAVVADFKDEASAAAAGAALTEALGGAPPDHVVSVQGFVRVVKAPTASPLSDLEGALHDGLTNNFLAAKTLLPAMKGREGSSFTLVSGGLAHFPPPDPSLWLGTVKNAALNALTYALASETANDKVRVNTVCIHFSVAPVGGDKNQFGMPAERDTLSLGPAFLAIARGTHKGQLLCVGDWAAVDALVKSA